MIPTKFTKTVTVYDRNLTTLEFTLDEHEQKKPLYSLGEFTFRRPTVNDKSEIEVRTLAIVAPIGNLNLVPLSTFNMAGVRATIPRQVDKTPDAWDWNTVYEDRDLLAIYDAYAEGVREIDEKNGSAGMIGSIKN